MTGKGKLRYRRFSSDFGLSPVSNLWADRSGAVQSRPDPKIYVLQTSTSIVERCILMSTDPGDLVLDPTCGSGTTAYVAEQWGRRWITIDTSRVALPLARARLMGARYPYYLMADSPEGQLKEAEITRTAPSSQPTPAIAPGLAEWSVPIDQLGVGSRYYKYYADEARRLLTEAGHANGLKTTLNFTGGYGRDLVDAVQLVQQYLKEAGIEAELRQQEYGAYMATTFAGKYEGMAIGPISIAWEPDSAMYAMYVPDHPRNSGHVNDPGLLGMLKEQRRTRDREARKKLIFDIQRHIAEQQYYVFTISVAYTSSWQPYVKNFAQNLSFDNGGRTAALWLDK